VTTDGANLPDFESGLLGQPPPNSWRYLPDSDSLSASARALKELVGQLVVRMSAASHRVGVG
jgi:hypothetical protein